MSTEEIFEYIYPRLLEQQIDVRVHRAVKTNSIYLELDGGALGRVRISDHFTKVFKYKWEIGEHIKRTHKIPKTRRRREEISRYPLVAMDRMIRHIIEEHDKMVRSDAKAL